MMPFIKSKILFVCCLVMGFFLMPLTTSANGGETTKDQYSSKIEWLTFQEAIERNKENPKKIFIDVYTDWCTWCMKMDKATFEHPSIATYINENFYPVKLDAEMSQTISFRDNLYYFNPKEGKHGVHEIALYLTRGRLNYPSIVFLDENMTNPQPVPGFQNPVRMDKLLKFFGENYYKQVDWGLFNQIYKSPISESGMPKLFKSSQGKLHDGARH